MQLTLNLAQLACGLCNVQAFPRNFFDSVPSSPDQSIVVISHLIIIHQHYQESITRDLLYTIEFALRGGEKGPEIQNGKSPME